MAHHRQHALIVVAIGMLVAGSGLARRFYPDDPLAKEPVPVPVANLRIGGGDDMAALIQEALRRNTEKVPRTPALDINTIDEVPDSAWYTNRHYFHPMADARLTLGPDGSEPPSTEKPWTIYDALEGTSPIFRVEDSRGRHFILRFDPKQNIELTTGAYVVASRLLYALGYNVPDNYAVRFGRSQLRVGNRIRFIRDGHSVLLREADVDHLLSLTPQYSDGSYRALASRLVEGVHIGPFGYSGTRPDDPNDTIPHERRRVLRGLFVFAAWLNLADTRSGGTLDTIQTVEGPRAVRHYLTEFGSALGSSELRPKEVWEGHTYELDFPTALKELGTLGAYAPSWVRRKPSKLPAAGGFDGDTFDPGGWKPIFPNPAFDGRTAADGFWAAKQVGSFTDDQIRTIISAGRYSDPETVENLTQTMIARRDAITAWYFARTLPLDNFSVRDGVLRFHDLGGGGDYGISWFRFDNEKELRSPIDDARSWQVPAISGYLAAYITDGTHEIAVYLLDGRVVGVER